MKHHLRPAVAAILFLCAFASVARAQFTMTVWLPTSGTADYWDEANWNGALPNIALGYSHPPDDFGSQTAQIKTASTAVVTSTFATADQLWVGKDGSTSGLSVESGGVLTANSIFLGYDASSTGNGTVTGEGGRITGGALLVGSSGTGTLTISNGGTVESSMLVAWQPGSVGTVTLTGWIENIEDPESSVRSTANGINGGSGNASITVTDHALVVGSVAGGNGTADITISNYASVGGGVYGGPGTTHITITDHATVSGSVASSPISDHGDVDITVSDSATVSGGLDLNGDGVGSFTIDTGAALIDGGISLSASGTATATFDGGSHTLTAGIYVSGTGSNTLTVQNNATVDGSGTENDSIIGYNSGDSGTLNLTGGSSWTTGGALYIGDSGEGSVNISGGSTLTASGVHVGSSSGGYGQLTINGEGAALHVTSAFTVGEYGSGSVTVSNDAHLTLASESVTMAGGGGNASITLTAGGQLTVGEGFGHLHLNTETGGFGFLNIGADAGSCAAAPGFLNAAVISASTNGVAVLTFNHTSEAYFFDPVITGGVFVAQKAGTTLLTGANDYTGGNYISGGVLAAGNENALGSGYVHLDGGTLDVNGQSQTSGTLMVSAQSYINFSGTSSLFLADSSAPELAWTGWVDVINFDSLDDTFRIGTDGNGLTADQLSRINLGGFAAQINGDGYISASDTAFTAPVPEPSTYAALAGLATLGAAVWRRRSRLAAAATRGL